jgi:hypothetical protein
VGRTLDRGSEICPRLPYHIALYDIGL